MESLRDYLHAGNLQAATENSIIGPAPGTVSSGSLAWRRAPSGSSTVEHAAKSIVLGLEEPVGVIERRRTVDWDNWLDLWW